jgi:hypothetical protein
MTLQVIKKSTLFFFGLVAKNNVVELGDSGLKSLKFNNVKISRSEAKKVGAGLSAFVQRFKLEEISLRGLGSVCVGYFVDCFPFSDSPQCDEISLKLLDISDNELGDFGAKKLANFISRNWNLRHVNLDKNSLNIVGFQSIFQSIALNRKLISWKFPWQNLDEAARKFSRDALERIRTLVLKLHELILKNFNESSDSMKDKWRENSEKITKLPVTFLIPMAPLPGPLEAKISVESHEKKAEETAKLPPQKMTMKSQNIRLSTLIAAPKSSSERSLESPRKNPETSETSAKPAKNSTGTNEKPLTASVETSDKPPTTSAKTSGGPKSPKSPRKEREKKGNNPEVPASTEPLPPVPPPVPPPVEAQSSQPPPPRRKGALEKNAENSRDDLLDSITSFSIANLRRTTEVNDRSSPAITSDFFFFFEFVFVSCESDLFLLVVMQGNERARVGMSWKQSFQQRFSLVESQFTPKWFQLIFQSALLLRLLHNKVFTAVVLHLQCVFSFTNIRTQTPQ